MPQKTLLYGILNANDLKKMKRQSWTIFIILFYIICKIKFPNKNFALVTLLLLWWDTVQDNLYKKAKYVTLLYSHIFPVETSVFLNQFVILSYSIEDTRKSKKNHNNHLIHLIAQSFRNSYMQTFCGNLNRDLTNWAYHLPIPLESMFYWEIYFFVFRDFRKQVNTFQWGSLQGQDKCETFHLS